MKVLSAILLLWSSYTLLSVSVQYLLPLAVISLVYGKIYFFLKVIYIILGEKDTSNEFQKRLLNLNRPQKRKMKRTTVILLIISLVFCVRSWTVSSVSQFRKYPLFFSWLPFSILRIVNEVFLDINNTSTTMLLLHLVCHLLGVSSICSNPLLYGLLNSNIWKEYSLLVAQLRKLPNIFNSRAPRQEEVELANL